jgi:transcriptional regulator GlxA family with amidase domain
VAASSANRLLRVATDALTSLPPSIARGVEEVFDHPERFRSVSQLADASGSTRRSLDRWLARAGLAPARTLLACARTNAAFNLLATGRTRVSDAAEQLGYPSPRALSREMHALTGHSARSIVSVLQPDALAARLQRRILRDANS